jgi:hypothetical protein
VVIVKTAVRVYFVLDPLQRFCVPDLLKARKTTDRHPARARRGPSGFLARLLAGF